MSKIIISGLRHISRLEFTIPGQGVHLLTGTNGSGKTSLLACLRRIGDRYAFGMHFPRALSLNNLDSSEGAKITYETPAGTVTYSAGKRWSPTPRTHSKALLSLGYPSVLYIAANAERIEPRIEEFTHQRIRAADPALIATVNRIFDTSKFDNLKVVNLRRGVGADAFLLEIPGARNQPKRYYSERHLSLGELCILKLIKTLKDCQRGSLVLIDELELALHPLAQSALLAYLHTIADEKQLTIIFSTHSSTLIKSVARRQILMLQAQQNGIIDVVRGCFPSYVLGAVADREEAATDVIIYVEDDAARVVTEQFAQKFLAAKYSAAQIVPSFSVVAVGGIVNVLRFFDTQVRLLPAITRGFVVLDADAEEALENATKQDIIDIRDRLSDQISFLPFTPEVGLVNYLRANRDAARNALRAHYNNNSIAIRLDWLPGLSIDNPRESAKTIVSALVDRLLTQIPGVDAADIRAQLLKLLAAHTFTSRRATVMQLMGPLLG
ncbi:ATP-dependent nuclease [Achromobacter deleyi]|uniref:ATP-dependent nuclease n=1 Tax=Achromobacter deleyi TaxID=1353891 RepID=UPI001E3B6432|nr:AAA family ATPase [Achromobacter deleyi]